MSTQPLKIRLAQISQRVAENYYLPYSAGLLQAYAQQRLQPENAYLFLPPVYRRLTQEEGLEAFEGVDVAGFSVYVWNIRRSLMIAQALKQRQPATLIIFGGPQVPDQAEGFLREHPFIDLCVHGPGEEVFCQIIESPSCEHWQQIPGLSWLAEGSFRHTPPAPRTRDLSVIPSPFLTGVFDPLLQEHDSWYTTFETNRGCPFSCTFCDWGSALQSKVVPFELERIEKDVEWMAQHGIKSVFCADANFGILKRDVEIAQRVAQIRYKYGYPQAFQIQTAKNISARVVEIQSILTRAGLSATAAISFQSLHPETLKAIKRENISLKAYREIQAACLQNKIFSYTDMIMSLPGETYDSFANGLNEVIVNGQYNRILLHEASILPNAEMADPAYRERYGLQTAEVVIPAHKIPPDGLPELLEIIVATKDLPPEDWRRLHVFAWMTCFLFYTHKLLQVVLIVLHHQLGVSYRSLIELFSEGDVSAYPILSQIQAQFWTSAAQQQKGYPESEQNTLVQSPLEGTYLTPDITMQYHLAHTGLLDSFYAEAAHFLGRFVREYDPQFSMTLLRELFQIARHSFLVAYSSRGLPIQGIDLAKEPPHFMVTHNLAEFFELVLKGEKAELVACEPRRFPK